LPQTNYLTSVWGSSPTDVWAVGAKGVILHDEGGGFGEAVSPTTSDLFLVHGSAPGDAWAIGADGVILRLQGQTWSVFDQPSGSNWSGLFARAPEDAWLVGSDGVGSVVKHWDGAAWSKASVPAGDYKSVWASGPNDLFLLDYFSTLQHWDGTSLTPQTLSHVGMVDAVWATGPDDVWACGSYNYTIGFEHWDGKTWTLAPGDEDVDLCKSLWGNASDGMFALGSARLWRLSGTSWKAEKSIYDYPYELVLEAGFVSGQDTWVVGGDGAALKRHDAQDSLNIGTLASLRSMWGASDSDFWAVGLVDGIAESAHIVHVVDGTLSGQKLYVDSMNGVWGSSASDIWAVGGDFVVPAIMHYDGTSWQSFGDSLPLGDSALSSVWGTGPHDVFFAGYRNLAHWDGATLVNDPISKDRYFSSVWGAAPDDVWAVGDTFAHYDGDQWTLVGAALTDALAAISGTAANDIWAVGATIKHYDGTQWTDAYQPTAALYAVRSLAKDDVYAVGDGGLVLHYDGKSWQSLSDITDAPLFSIWATKPSQVFFGGATGNLLKRGN
jgi:hypothetical protein